MDESINLNEMLEKHQHWLAEDCEGWESMRMILTNADLSGANLKGVNLAGATIYGCDLSNATLDLAILYGAALVCSNLANAELRGTNLYAASLTGANLSGAILSRGTILDGADLKWATFDSDTLSRYYPIRCPEVGSFIAWKKAWRNRIVKLRIPEDAKRSSALGQKCRASKAEVLAIENLDGTPADTEIARSTFNNDFEYKIGETVEVPDFDDDRFNECAPGIHFFLTRQEAVDYI